MRIQRSILTSIVFLFAFSGAAEAAKPAKKPVSVPIGVMEALKAKQSQDVIVEFDSSAVQAEADVQRHAAHLDRESPKIIEFKAARYSDIKRTSLARLAAAEHAVMRDYSHLPLVFLRLKSVNALNALLRDPMLKAIYKDEIKRPVLDSTSLSLVKQPVVANLGYTGAGATVVVIDTGVDYTRADFGCTTPGIPASCKVNYYADYVHTGTLDSSGHGTNVSGIVVGVAPAAKVAGINVFGANTYTTDSLIIYGINWAIANQAAYNIAAINMSLADSINHGYRCDGGAYDTPLFQAYLANITVAVAAGNDGFTDGLSSPACASRTVKAVGAVYSANIGATNLGTCSDASTAADQVTCFSNFTTSSYPDTIYAPGVNQTAGGYTFSGTSQATPYVSAAAAIVKAAFPSPSAAQLAASGGYYRQTVAGLPINISRSGVSTTSYRLDIAQSLSPAGDSFAYPLSYIPSFVSNNILATKEFGEPSHAGNAGGKSVWASFVSNYYPTSVSVDTHLSDFDTLLAVYTGNSVSALTLVAANDDDGSANGNSGLVFTAQTGVTYHVAVDGKNGASGLYVYNLKYTPPINDNFSARSAIISASGQATGVTLSATHELGEPSHANLPSGNSVWWSWTAPASGQVTLDTHGSGIGTVLAAYTGASVGNLSAQAANDNDGTLGGTSSVLFVAQSGVQYQIAVEGDSGAQGNVILNWSLNTSPTANLSLSISASGDTLTGLTYTGSVTNAGPGIAVNSRLTLTLPAGVTYLAGTAGCTAAGSTVTCSFGNLVPGVTNYFNIVGSASTPGNYSASASIASDVTDPVTSNNTAALTTNVKVAVANNAYLNDDIPTLPEWGVILMGLLLGSSMMWNEKKRCRQD